jgi:arsenate reductase (glutaredoxin)
MLKIYHNPRCRKSREGLNYLKNKTTGFEIVDYLKDGLTAEMLDEIFLKSNLKPEQLVRTQEEAYKKELKGRSFTKEEWKRIFIENPKLLQRPIVVSKQKAVLAQPPENLDKLL